MNGNIVFQSILLFCFCYSCETKPKENGKPKEAVKTNSITKPGSSGIHIDSIYNSLANRRSIYHEQVPGEFIYQEPDSVNRIYTAKFNSSLTKTSIFYKSFSGERKDAMVIDNKIINLQKKLDPLSIVPYKLRVGATRFFAFLGKARSASGSGVQLTFFILVKLNNEGKSTNFYEFESRFGDINNLVDYYGDGNMDYFKIVNAGKINEYYLTINSVESNSQINEVHILLRYELNDKFTILNSNVK
jgi:hypothetical protein